MVSGATQYGQNAGQALSRFAGSTAASFVPYGGALAAAERISSPVMREQDTAAQAFAGRIPGLAGMVPPKTGFAGQPRRTGTENMVMNILSPVRVSEGRTGETAAGAREVYNLRRQREGTRRFVGSESASMDREIAAAVEKVKNWRRNPQGAPTPTAEEQALYQRFGARPNPVYEQLGQAATRRENRSGAVPILRTPSQQPAVMQLLANLFR